MAAVKAAALEAGAVGCTIGGAGPTAVAVIEGEEVGRRMVKAFWTGCVSRTNGTI
jgi:homoserine kinase